MKAVNLNTLIDAYEKLSKETLISYLSFYEIGLAEKGKNDGLKENELKCMKSFVSQFRLEDSLTCLDNFFVGYKIPQIGKEFDLLRINNQNVVNIELKTKADEEKVLKQLRRNSYYLKFLNKEMLLFSYVQNSNTLYMLNGENKLISVSFDVLHEKLLEKNAEIENIDKLFNPSNYLISPFNSTKQFMEEEYFLTEHQEEIKCKILKTIESAKAEFMALSGAAGTGKTLLTYDIAKELMNTDRKVLIVHCGKINEGQSVLQDKFGWRICMAKDIVARKDFSEFDVIIVDEAQRLEQQQFDDIKDKVEGKNMKCIFSYDEKQYLSDMEKNRGISSQILKVLTQTVFQLTTKIRANKEIASFIKPLFDYHEKISPLDYSNIDLYYCLSEKDVVALSKYLQIKGWKVLKYTPGMHSKFDYQGYGIDDAESAHAVIGQEFDKVVAVIDGTFKYNEYGKLVADAKYYSQRQMLYQILTRTRQKLYIIILNNEPMLKRCLEILKRV